MVKKIQDEQLGKINRQDAPDRKKSGPVLENTLMVIKINQLLNFITNYTRTQQIKSKEFGTTDA